MKCRFITQCRRATFSDNQDLFKDVRLDRHLKVIPNPGWHVKVTDDGEFYRVDDVFYDATPGDEMVEILLEPITEASLRPWAEMQRQGWQLGTCNEEENE